MKFNKKFLIILIGSIIVYSLFLILSDFSELSEEILDFEIMYLPLILILVPLGWLALYFRWTFLLKNSGYVLPHKKNFQIFLSGFPLSITPGKVGELLKCELGEATIFNNGEYGPLACTGKYGASGPKAAIYVRDRIGDNGKIFNDKNPYDTNNFAVKRGGTWVLGHIILHANPTTLTLYTCFKDPCGLAANHINTPISIP